MGLCGEVEAGMRMDGVKWSGVDEEDGRMMVVEEGPVAAEAAWLLRGVVAPGSWGDDGSEVDEDEDERMVTVGGGPVAAETREVTVGGVPVAAEAREVELVLD